MSIEFSDHAKSLLSDYYMKEGDKAPLETLRRACYAYTTQTELSERLYEYVKKGWFMFSSPILSNADGKGLPISCFLTYFSHRGVEVDERDGRWSGRALVGSALCFSEIPRSYSISEDRGR